MSYTTIAELRLALGVGTLYADAILQEVCDAADNILIPFLWTNAQSVTAQSNAGTVGTLYFNENIQDVFYVDQSVTITNTGTYFNGTKTITAVSAKSFDVTTTHTTDNVKHSVAPYGTAAAENYIDYSTIPAIQEASLMLSIDIFQSRQAPSSGGVTIDGYAPSPYRMGNTLLARVRGLLAPYLSPNSMVG